MFCSYYYYYYTIRSDYRKLFMHYNNLCVRIFVEESIEHSEELRPYFELLVVGTRLPSHFP